MILLLIVIVKDLNALANYPAIWWFLALMVFFFIAVTLLLKNLFKKMKRKRKN